MFKSLWNAMLEWNRSYNEREKLQHAYFVASLVIVLVAGIIGLVNQEAGKDFLYVSLAGAVVLVLNAVVWSLLESMIISRLSGRRKR